MLALFCALKQESEVLRRALAARERKARDGWEATVGGLADREVLLMQTGLGRDQAERATAFALSFYPVDALVSFGFGGALVPELKAGDIILYQRCMCDGAEGSRRPYAADAHLLSLAARVLAGLGLGSFTGSGLSTTALTVEPALKRALRESSGALAVDMESYWIARLASAREVPFLALRAVSDALAESLPPFDRFLAPNGALLWRTGIAHFLVHPGDAAKLPWVYANARRASTALARFLEEFVSALPTAPQYVRAER